MARKPNSRVVALRAQVAKAHRQATKKISRNKSGAGVLLSGSEFDPRVSPAKIKQATAAQLAAQLKRLEKFNARDNQFVGDMKHRPIPKTEWVEYKAAEKVYNDRVAQEFKTVEATVLPSGETVGQRAAKMKADHAMAGNPSVTPPHNAWTRQPFNIKNRAALKKLTDDARRKMSPDYDKEELKRQQDEMRQVLAMIKNPELDAGIAALTNRQFNILWNYSSFANDSSLWYEMVKLHGQGDDESWHNDIIDQKFDAVQALVKAAKDW